MQADLTNANLDNAVLKSVDLKHAILTGATFNNADLSDANLDDATFSRFKLPPRKAPARRNAHLGKAVAKAVGKGLMAEVQGGGDDDDQDTDDDDDDDDDADDSNELAEDEKNSLFSLDEAMFALDRMATAAASGLEQLLRVRTTLCAEFERIKQHVAEWDPPAIDVRTVQGKAQKLEAAVATMMQAKADELFEALEAAMVKALSDTSVGGLSNAAENDVTSDGLVKELGKAVLCSLVEDARQLLADRATPLIGEAAKGISVAAIQQASTDVPGTETEMEALLSAEEGRLPLAADMKDRLCKVLNKLGKILNASLDKHIQRKVKKFGSSLLDKANGGVTQLGVLKTKAVELEKKLKEKLTGSAVAIDALGLQLFFEQVDTSKDGKIELAEFKEFAQNVKLNKADDKKLEEWFAEMVAITKEQADNTAEERRTYGEDGKTAYTKDEFIKVVMMKPGARSWDAPIGEAEALVEWDKAGERVDLAGLEAWFAKNHDGPVGKWIFDRGLAKFLPTGKLGERLCKDRIRRALSGQTAYSETGLYGTVSGQSLLPWNPSHSMDSLSPPHFPA